VSAAGLVVFGEDWGRHPSSTQHLVRRLAEQRDVVWVNSIGLRRPRLDRADLGRVAGKLLRRRAVAPASSGAAAKAPPPSMSIVPPLAVSWPGSRLAAAANRALLGWQVRRALARRGLRKPILWTSLPTVAPLLGAFEERGVVYYCGDDFGALAGVDHAPVVAMERALAARADLIVAASPQLAERFPAGRTLVLPHGADVELFRRPVAAPADLRRDRRRVAGFYGSLSDWLDVELLTTAARRLPDWDFVLIGEVRTALGDLPDLPNVRLLGVREHAALPAYVQNWDVSLLPFRDNPQIRACNPLKLREYLAAGTPVASTPFPALLPYAGLIEVGRDADAFVRAIASAAGDSRRNVQRRTAVAGESWEARARDLASALETL
jgi:glycosyltransferase involved in cell wall biosynthesis